MHEMDDSYTQAMAQGRPRIIAYISVGQHIDATSADDITAITAEKLPLSDTSELCDAIYSLTEGLATFEGDGIPTSGGASAPPLSASEGWGETGIWSAGISDADGAISWTLTVSLSKDHTSALTIYTSGPSITAGSATFTAADGTTVTDALQCSDGTAQVLEARTYSTVAVTVTAISEPYRHVRIAEMEFGASRALSNSSLMEEVTAIEELDPTEQTLPMSEMDFTILNIDGVYDTDNPSSRISEYAVGLPVQLAFTAVSGAGRWTVPCGRYYIGERTATEQGVRIAAFDARRFLSQTATPWSITAGQSLGASIEALLTDMDIPHTIASSAEQIMPDASYTFSDDSTRLEDLLRIEQAYGIYLLPQRDGSILVTAEWPTGTAPSPPTRRLLSYPKARQATRYNVIVIGWASGSQSGYAQEDLREDSEEVKSVLQIIGNPLITTQARAQAVLNRLKARLISEEVETETLGDPAIDIGDSIPLYGRWTAGTPTTYAIRRIESTWDGVLKTVLRASR